MRALRTGDRTEGGLYMHLEACSSVESCSTISLYRGDEAASLASAEGETKAVIATLPK